MAERYVTRRIEAEAVQWTGSNEDEVRAFAGADFLGVTGDRLRVRNSKGEAVALPGYWVSREAGKPLAIYGPGAWEWLWERAGH